MANDKIYVNNYPLAELGDRYYVVITWNISHASHTLGHKSEQLERETAERMDAFIRAKRNKNV